MSDISSRADGFANHPHVEMTECRHGMARNGRLTMRRHDTHRRAPHSLSRRGYGTQHFARRSASLATSVLLTFMLYPHDGSAQRIVSRDQAVAALRAHRHDCSVGFLAECELLLQRGADQEFDRCHNMYFCSMGSIAPDLALASEYLAGHKRSVAVVRAQARRDAEARRALEAVAAREREEERLRLEAEARARVAEATRQEVARRFMTATPMVAPVALDAGVTVQWVTTNGQHIIDLVPVREQGCNLRVNEQPIAGFPVTTSTCRGSAERFTEDVVQACIHASTTSLLRCALVHIDVAGTPRVLADWTRQGGEVGSLTRSAVPDAVEAAIVRDCQVAIDFEQVATAWRRIGLLGVGAARRRECGARYTLGALVAHEIHSSASLREVRDAILRLGRLEAEAGLDDESRSRVRAAGEALRARVPALVTAIGERAHEAFERESYDVVHAAYEEIFAESSVDVRLMLAGDPSLDRLLREERIASAAQLCSEGIDDLAVLRSALEVLNDALVPRRFERVVARCRGRVRALENDERARAWIHGEWTWGNLNVGIVEMEVRADGGFVLQMPMSSFYGEYTYRWRDARHVDVMGRNGSPLFTLEVRKEGNDRMRVQGIPLATSSGTLEMIMTRRNDQQTE